MDQNKRPPKLPRVCRGEFNEQWTVEKLQAEIDKLPVRDRKLRILFVGEASFLKTGFSTYWDKVVSRLHKTGKYDIAELGSYASTNDPRAKNVPWKFYGVMPDQGDQQGFAAYGNPHGNAQERARYNENQFGKGRFDPIVAEFKPDIVVDLRDHWMTHWQKDSVFRDKFHWMWMACVDSYPQKWDWLKDYAKADTLLAYSFFGKDVIEKQSRSEIAKFFGVEPIDVSIVCQPGIDTDIYHPMDKIEVKSELHIPPQVQIIGTVMRNQKRKLFPRIIESFRIFKEKNGWNETDPRKKRIKNIDNIKLLLHTCVRDVGFDIPQAVVREGLQTEVLYSYLCPECGVYGISTFIGHPAKCPKCGKQSFITPNTQIGLPDEQFSKLFNLMDVYVQMSIAEGDGMPVQNAKACGVPVVMSDYAALAEKARNGGGIPVKGDLETESETMQWRHWFDRNDFVDKLTKLFKKSGYLGQKGREARRCIEEYYDWDLTAKKWEYIFDTTEVNSDDERWAKKIEVVEMPSDKLHKREGLSNEEFVALCYKELLGREPDEDGMKNWVAGLQQGQERKSVENFFRGQTSRKNQAATLLGQGNGEIALNPIERIAKDMNETDQFRILYCMPETAGDVLISTGIITALKKKYPHASLYVATQKKYFDILENNPHVDGVFEYNQALDNYRTAEPFGPSVGFVDLCFNPYIVTQRIPHWIHGGLGESLGVTYGHLCNLNLTDNEIQDGMFIDFEEVEGLPAQFVTFHGKTTQDPKDYSNWNAVFARLSGLPIVQIGGKDEPLLEHPDVVDMRGKTTPQQLAYIISKAKLHIGLDSFPAHVANAVGTKSVLVYGGTYARQGGILNSDAIEPVHRNGCHTSCHLVECIQKKNGGRKCIDNILPDTIVEAIKKHLDSRHILPEKTITLSAYCIIKDGNRFGFPYKKCIEAALKIADEFVMVDGGSTDGTYEDLLDLANSEPRLKVSQHVWDMNNPMLMGNEKTYARQQCTNDYLIQLDADEIIVEKEPGQIKKMIKANPQVPIFDLPVVNFYGNDQTVRVDDSIWKWRISKNESEIVHGVHGAARDFDPDTMQMVYDKKVSDSCEYIHRDTLEIMQHVSILPPQAHQLHAHIMNLRHNDQEIPTDLLEQYADMVKQIVDNMPLVFHYSWYNLGAKKGRGEFWDNTFHGKKEETHNTTKDIATRIEDSKELTVSVDILHPLKDQE